METKLLTDKEVENLSSTCKEINKYDLEPLFDLLINQYGVDYLERIVGDIIAQFANILTNYDYNDDSKCELPIYPPDYNNNIYFLTELRKTFIEMQENAENKKFEIQLRVRQQQD